MSAHNRRRTGGRTATLGVALCLAAGSAAAQSRTAAGAEVGYSRADLVGPNLAIMWPPETNDVAIAVPGGFYVRATSGTPISGNTATVWFQRDELTRSIRAGIGAGMIDPNQPLTLPLIAGGGFVIGTDVVTLRY